MVSAVWIAGFAARVLCIAGIVSSESIEDHLDDQITLRVPGTTVPFTMVRCEGATLTRNDQDESATIQPCYVLTTEVTWDLYDIYVYELDEPDGTSKADAVSRPSKPYIPPDRGFGHEGYPAIGMTYQAANGFCEWLTLKTGLAFRLPTAEEWTYFAVGESEELFCCGITKDSLTEHAWFDENAEQTTQPVAQKAKNLFGLYDIHGNAAEWVVTDSRRPVAMGGGYLDSAENCTAQSIQMQQRDWNRSDPQIPKSTWWLADCSWVGFRFLLETESIDDATLKGLLHE